MIDCHFHLDSGLVPATGLLASMDAFGVEKAALIACMCTDLAPTFPARAGAPVFRRGASGGSRLVRRLMRNLYKNWVKKNGSVDVGGRRYEVFPQPDNRAAARAVAAHPGRFFGWIFVNPRGPAAPVEEIEAFADLPGFIGVKAHPFWHDYPLFALSDAAAMCREKGLAMLIHLGTGKNGDFTLLPRRFPEVNFIYAHAGVPYFKAVWDFAASVRNVFVDLSAPSYVDAKVAARALSRAGVLRCLFGSDGPYFGHENGRYDYGEVLSVLKACGLDNREYAQVAGKNFLEAIGRG